MWPVQNVPCTQLSTLDKLAVHYSPRRYLLITGIKRDELEKTSYCDFLI